MSCSAHKNKQDVPVNNAQTPVPAETSMTLWLSLQQML